MRILLITPPILQCNTPYAATPLLTASLRAAGLDAHQADASQALFLRIFSRHGLERVRAALLAHPPTGDAGRHFVAQAPRYLAAIDPVIRFLQGKDPTLCHRLLGGDFLPRGPRFDVMHAQETDADGTLHWAFGSMGVADHARYVATLFLDDLAQVIREDIDPAFGLSRYEEQLAVSLPTFDPLLARLQAPPTLVDDAIDAIAGELWAAHQPGFIGITVPFPGCLYGALRLARRLRQLGPGLPVALGGGYVNTELRDLQEPRLFDDVDYVCLDAGPGALVAVIRHAQGQATEAELVRTFVRRGGVIQLTERPPAPVRERVAELPPPTYDGLPLGDYVSVMEMLNPMHALWSTGRWNKLMLAHGCYWQRCSFCDTSLDYIKAYAPSSAQRVVDNMERVAAETGQTGFHFVDEAAPPALLRRMAEEILRRGLAFTWWGNIRFEKTFDRELTAQLAASGCIAVTGGLEAFTDRLLTLIDKGFTVPEATRVCDAFAGAGILVHAYLMYGLPTQTARETVDCLERVRQLFLHRCIHSAYWHRFTATVHSDMGQQAERFSMTTTPRPATFARNEIPFRDRLTVDHTMLGEGLRKALYNYMHGVGLEQDVRAWFPAKTPRPSVPPDEIARLLDAAARQ